MLNAPRALKMALRIIARAARLRRVAVAWASRRVCTRNIFIAQRDQTLGSGDAAVW